MSAPVVVTAQVAYFPPESALTRGGKYHAARLVSQVAACGAPATLEIAGAIRTSVGQVRVHPIVCRSCLRISQADPSGVLR